jgi:ATP-dependent exoDNAse (exonuclease V) alpha subunit
LDPRRIQFLAKDRAMGVDNGTFGTVRKVSRNGCMTVDLGDDHTVAFDTKEYNAITYGYAATVHKLQGATVDRCYVLAAQGFDQHLAYVAMSRHRYAMHLFLDRLAAHARQGRAKLILLGDTQLAQSVGSGGAYRGVIERSQGNVVRIDRTKDAFDRQALAKALLRQDAVAAARAVDLLAGENMIFKAHKSRIFETVVDDWLQAVRHHRSYRSHLMLTYRNDDVSLLNELARERLSRIGYLDRSAEISVETHDRKPICFAPGDRILFLRKDLDLDIQGGAAGSVRHTGHDRLDVRLDDGTRIEVNTKLYNDLAHGYAANIYKAASMRVDHTYILAGARFDKQSFAAALEVHAKSARIYHSTPYPKFRKIVSTPRDKELAADYPLQGRAYKITVTPFDGARSHTTFIKVDPHDIALAALDDEHLKRHVRRQARDYAEQVVFKAHLRADQIKRMTIKVEPVSMEQYLRHQQRMDRAMHKDRGRGIEF